MELTPDELHDLLTRVAAGDLDPTEAGRRLDEDPSVPTVDKTTVPAAAVVVRAGGVHLTVVADPTVSTVVVAGPHAVRHEGSTTIVETPSSDGYQTQPPPRLLGWIPTTWTGGRGERVTVRINPSLALSVEATACGVKITGLTGELTLGGTGSSVKVLDHRGAVHGGLSMGSLSLAGAITGPSDLSCELGNLALRLSQDCDLTLAASAEMGSLKISGAATTGQTRGDGAAQQSLRLGRGTHPFAVNVRMGSATVVVS
ncbi:MAG TPA: hypothetical protein VFN19_04800 [Candidatus Nanopelagicales bacterium]|jgi:hypothetical protein|nr:hypothetical protein [Candidatus Nanopelagicales bacterium]